MIILAIVALLVIGALLIAIAVWNGKPRGYELEAQYAQLIREIKITITITPELPIRRYEASLLAEEKSRAAHLHHVGLESRTPYKFSTHVVHKAVR